MSKYPYTFEEYKEMTEKEYLRKYCEKDKKGGSEILKDKEIQDVIKNSYNGRKYEHEHGISKAMDKLDYEVSGAVYCIFNMAGN